MIIKLENRKKMHFLALGSLLVSLLMADSIHADVMVGLAADNWIAGTAAGDGTSGTGAFLVGLSTTNMFVGRYTSTQVSSAILVFQLPTLQAGEFISSASFSFTTLQQATAVLEANIDLYGLGYRASSTVAASDFYVGALDTTNATLLREDLFTKWTAVSAYNDQSHVTDAAANINIVNYLNAQYANGATGGEYIFIRLNYDTYTSGLSGRIVLATADNTTTGYAPFITYEIAAIPEPVSLSLLALSAGALAMRRRK